MGTNSRSQRVACRCPITYAHLLASSAIPFIFPAVKVNREYFGDGSMRQLAPISPAIHLGASRVLVVGAGRINEPNERVQGSTYPTLRHESAAALTALDTDTLYLQAPRWYEPTDAELATRLKASPTTAEGYADRAGAFAEKYDFDHALADIELASRNAD